jgi:HAD superfamily hydrolase (TIGR01509 family)
MKIKALLLDLGNVTVRLRPDDFFGGLGRACRPPLDLAQTRALLANPTLPHADYECGRVDGRAMHQAMRQRLGMDLEYPAWLELWNGFFEPNRPMEALLARLGGQLRLWGLSNTNAEHLAFLRLHYRVLGRFEGITASNEVGMAKPEAGIYRAAIQSLGISADEILYVDDVAAYVEAGQSLGMQAFHYTFNDLALRDRLAGLGFELPPLGGVSALGC